MGGDVLGPLPAVHWSQGRALGGALASHAVPWALAEPPADGRCHGKPTDNLFMAPTALYCAFLMFS